MKKLAVIYNPVAGKGADKKAQQLLRDLAENDFEYESFSTEFPEHAETIMYEICCNFDLICVAGGDGTIQQALNGAKRKLLENEKLTQDIALYGIGSGNDFVRTAGFKIPIIDKIKKYMNGDIKTESYYFIKRKDGMIIINSMSAGMDAKIVYNHDKLNLRFLSGSVSYLVSAILTFLFYKTKNYKISYTNNGEEIERTIDAYIVVAANSPYYGGGMKIAPDASNRSDLMQICLIHKMNPWKLLFELLPKLYKGEHSKVAGVEMIMTKYIKVDMLDGKDLVNFDGELSEQNGFEASKYKIDRLKLI